VTLFQTSRLFYNFYPQIGNLIYATPSHKLQTGQICATPSHEFVTPANEILAKLSFSHIREIMTQKDPLARFFYETECIKGTWSVKELRRQISTNLYFRSGASLDPKKLLASIKPETNSPALTIRQPFTFEFLGLQAKDVITESDLEEALITHLQDFLLELGKGFCFEARQKRMIIDDEYYYADLVFYNRLLHCSVIVELKNDEFHHEYLGQLNAYVSYYKENEMHAGDNPPVGILLCTRKGTKMVEYAIAGMDNNLFVSTYMLQLPDKATLEQFLLNEIEDMHEQDL
jgi:predicted nuclease of restriction endonuclease-like (RecB) superfamily